MLTDFTRRLFFNRSTTYFLFSFLCACSQIILRTALLVTDNDGARRGGAPIYPTSQYSTQVLYSLLSDGGLEYCTDLPGPCKLYALDDIRANPDGLCAAIGAYSSNLFRDNGTEDIVFIVIHTYLLFITVYAIARESIPHIIVIFSIRCLSTIWALGRVIETALVEKSLDRLVEAARCQTDFFGTTFFSNRHTIEGCLLGISLLSVGIEAFVANKLGKVYSQRPWRVVQVSSEMRKMYRLLLGFSVIVQVAALILPTAMALWVDQLVNTYFSHIVGKHAIIYGCFFIFMVVSLPMTILGWYSLRREWTHGTIVFLAFVTIFLCSGLAIFGSAMFRWAFTTWWFFGTLCTAALVLLGAILVLAVLCRRNFGKNLDHYLFVQSRLSGMDFAHDHFEKDPTLDEAEVPKHRGG